MDSHRIAFSRLFVLRNWLSVVAAFILFEGVSRVVAQIDSTVNTHSSTNTATNPPAAAANNSATNALQTTLAQKLVNLRLGPFDLHPRLATGFVYDDNILLSTAHKEADVDWIVQPAIQAIAGDDAALIPYRDLNIDVLSLTPGGFIIQQPEMWPGELLMLDYGPRFQTYDKYTANNSIDQFAALDVLWPMNKLILGLRQDYQLQKEEIIEFDQRTTVESISSALSAAYQFGNGTSMESNLRRTSMGYESPNLTGYTEYNTEDWFNYEVAPDLPVSLGVLAGQDDVANHQDQTYEQLRARARYNYTEKLVFDVSVGGELRQFENGTPEKLSPVFTLTGFYRPTERTTLTLTGSRQQYASIFNGYNYAVTGAAFEVRQGITDRFTAALSAGYYSIDYTATDKELTQYTGDYYVPRLSLEAKIVRHLNGKIYYQFLSSRSQANSGVNDNQTGAQLTLSF